jgi:hypothetical protein
MVTVVGCRGSSRDFPNLVIHTRSSPASRSTSSRSSRIASPTRSPLTASRPINVW